MRKTILALALILPLTGCATTGGINQTEIDKAILEVQAAARAICGIVPYADSILAIVGTFTTVPGGASISTLAHSMCAAFTANKSARRGASREVRGTLRGVTIRGYRA